MSLGQIVVEAFGGTNDDWTLCLGGEVGLARLAACRTYRDSASGLESQRRFAPSPGCPHEQFPVVDSATDEALAVLLAKASGKLDDAGEEDRSEIIDLIEMIKDARTSGDTAAPEDARQQLQDLLFYLET